MQQLPPTAKPIKSRAPLHWERGNLARPIVLGTKWAPLQWLAIKADSHRMELAAKRSTLSRPQWSRRLCRISSDLSISRVSKVFLMRQSFEVVGDQMAWGHQRPRDSFRFSMRAFLKNPSGKIEFSRWRTMGSSPFAKRAASARRDATLAASRSFRSNCFSSPMLEKNSCPRPRSQTSTTPGTRPISFEQSDRRNEWISSGLEMRCTDREDHRTLRPFPPGSAGILPAPSCWGQSKLYGNGWPPRQKAIPTPPQPLKCPPPKRC